MSEAERRQLYESHVVDLIDVISLDPSWRRRLWDAPVGERIEVDAETLARVRGEPGRVIREHALRFVVFNDGDTDDGGCVFGFESAEFADVVTYSTNWNPGWGST